jgi:hypothetical protein
MADSRWRSYAIVLPTASDCRYFWKIESIEGPVVSGIVAKVKGKTCAVGSLRHEASRTFSDRARFLGVSMRPV